MKLEKMKFCPFCDGAGHYLDVINISCGDYHAQINPNDLIHDEDEIKATMYKEDTTKSEENHEH